MNNPKKIIVHCSATKEGEDFDLEDIKSMHLQRGFNDIGYHFVIKLDGKIQYGREVFTKGAHARIGGNNNDTIGVCYIGGLDKDGNPKDTRTMAQQSSLLRLNEALILVFPNINEIVGHRDLSPDLDGDGKVEPFEWLKQCPCFDAISEYQFLTNK